MDAGRPGSSAKRRLRDISRDAGPTGRPIPSPSGPPDGPTPPLQAFLQDPSPRSRRDLDPLRPSPLLLRLLWRLLWLRVRWWEIREDLLGQVLRLPLQAERRLRAQAWLNRPRSK